MINNRQNGRRRGRGPQQVRTGNGSGGQDRGNRIDNRARGNAAQLLEKYKNLARDCQMQGDRVLTEYYHQFADHYFRVLSESRSRFDEQNPGQAQGQPRRANNDQDDEFGDGGDEYQDEGERYDQQPRYPQRSDGQRQDGQQRQDYERQAQQRDGQSRDNQSRDSQSRDYQSRDGQQRDSQSRDGQQRDGQQRDGQQRDTQPRYDRDHREAPARVERPRTPVEQPQVADASPVAADDGGEDDRRPRRRRGRRAETEGETPTLPGIDADRLPPSLAARETEAPRISQPVEAQAEPAGVDTEEAPKRRRTRRPKDGDTVVAA